MLQHIPKLFDEQELRDVHSLIAQTTWYDGRASAGTLAVKTKNNAQMVPDSDAAQALRAMVQTKLDKSDAFTAIALPKKLSHLGFNRYSQTDTGPEFYGPHVDNAVRFSNEHGQRVRTDISCTLFLSEPQSYEGGELAIQNGLVEQRVKLAAGDMILYPSTSIHQVTPVLKGTRLACFFWVESMIRSNEQRSLLLDLDNAIRSLRSKHGDSAEVLTLNTTYHNLLRQWADS